MVYVCALISILVHITIFRFLFLITSDFPFLVKVLLQHLEAICHLLQGLVVRIIIFDICLGLHWHH
jgi:hypothetical protein